MLTVAGAKEGGGGVPSASLETKAAAALGKTVTDGAYSAPSRDDNGDGQQRGGGGINANVCWP